jgi:hypothetical protein
MSFVGSRVRLVAQHIVWRHRALWSYRVDLFLCLPLGYLVAAMGLGGICFYTYAGATKMSEIRRMIHSYGVLLLEEVSSIRSTRLTCC